MTTPDAVDLWSNDRTIDTWRRYSRLHNALVPYLYAYATVAHETGIPTMRHLALHHPDEPEALGQDHQYLLGSELLIAPVVTDGATTRRVWFPPGAWFGFWDDVRYDGPGYVDVAAPIEQIPLFVRGGAVLPLLGTPVVSLANTGPAELLANLELRFAPTGSPGTAEFTFHDGSTVVVREDEGRVAFDVGEEFQWRRVVVRVPRAIEITHASADGVEVPFATDDPGQDARWNAAGNPGTVVRTPRGVMELVLRTRQ